MSNITVSFPNMGNSWVAFKGLIESVPGLKVQLPVPVNRETVEIGAKYSPEFVCFPFKINVGDFILTHEKYGIDTFVTALDCGPCRFGFYHAVQERILRDQGYDIKIIPLDQADLLSFNWLKTFDEFYEITGERNDLNKFMNTTNSALNFLRKAKIVGDLEQLEAYYRCREMKKGETGRTMKRMMNELDATSSSYAMKQFRTKMVDEFASIPHDNSLNPLKVTLTGEIHITLEPYVNLDMRRKLGDMGVEVHQHLSLIDWVTHKFHMNFHRRELARLSKPYLAMDIGGEAQWVIGEYVESMKHGMDGLIHMYPFTCMPEVTARSIITAFDEPKIPAIFFSFDEQTGSEGMKTRLEAFYDLMEDRRAKDLKVPADPEYDTERSMISDIINSVKNPMQTFLDPLNIAGLGVEKPLENIQNLFGELFKGNGNNGNQSGSSNNKNYNNNNTPSEKANPLGFLGELFKLTTKESKKNE